MELRRKQKGANIPKAPKSQMTDEVVSYLRNAAQTQSMNMFAETLASLLKEPKTYLVRALV